MLRLPRYEPLFPSSVGEAVELKARFGADAMFVAGGTDIVPKMKRRQFTPKYLIFLKGISELSGVRVKGSSVSIGPLTRLSAIKADKAIRDRLPALSDTAGMIATLLIQNMGTIGGNLLVDTRCTYYDQNYFWRKSIDFCLKKDGCVCWVAPSSPKCMAVSSSDLAPVLIAYGAKVRLVSRSGGRIVPLAKIYKNDGKDYLALRRDELLSEIVVKVRRGQICFYKKLRRREAFDFPALGMACSAVKNGAMSDIKFVLTGCGSAPIEVPVKGRFDGFGKETRAQIRERLYSAGKPLDNTDFNMTWRKQVIKVFADDLMDKLESAASSSTE